MGWVYGTVTGCDTPCTICWYRKQGSTVTRILCTTTNSSGNFSAYLGNGTYIGKCNDECPVTFTYLTYVDVEELIVMPAPMFVAVTCHCDRASGAPSGGEASLPELAALYAPEDLKEAGVRSPENYLKGSEGLSATYMEVWEPGAEEPDVGLILTDSTALPSPDKLPVKPRAMTE